MTPEEFEKVSNFILQQQAQFASNFTQVEGRMTQIEALIGRLAAVTTEGFKDVGEKINALVNAQIKNEDRLEKLTEAGRAANERMNALMVMFERYIEGRNGKEGK